MAQRSRRTSTARRGGTKVIRKDNEGIIPVLARSVREVEQAAERGKVAPHGRATFQVVALLVRDERQRLDADTELGEGRKAEQLKRLDGIATILARAAARDTSLLQLLAEDAEVSEGARALKRQMLKSAGIEIPEEVEGPKPETAATTSSRRTTPQSVISRQLANPFLKPDFSAAEEHRVQSGRLANWELLEPLFKSFEYVGGGASACMRMPDSVPVPGVALMAHQAQLVAAAAAGHRTFLLADEPGLGKTAQALLAAQAAHAWPLLCVVPNVVKANWAHEASLWTPNRSVTVIHGDGEEVDGFADIIVVNYEVLDRHVEWLGNHGFRGMVVDEAHFIKNKSSQRSQHVLELSERLRTRVARPLLMALTGTPLINDIEDFRAIWQFLGWIDDHKPLPALMNKLEDTGLMPGEPGFYPNARRSVIEMGIVRRRKIDVAADIPARRVADLPVELEGAEGRSIRDAERNLSRRLVSRYDAALEARTTKVVVDGIDLDLVRRVAKWEREDMESAKDGENVFSMMRRIGQAKAGLAADYTAQLARSVGKVVFFAKHIDVMDEAQASFEKRGISFVSIRGDQSAKARAAAIESFTKDPETSIIVCSLSAAGVGLNLQVASNVVLAELSWTDAEQTQAIDRIHRIGQSEPVTAWRIIAAQTIDSKIAELIDSKAGLAARALDGADEIASSVDVQLEALVGLLTDALEARGGR
ncbi:MAG: ATP-dependent helicase HepA [Nocardioides sp.]|uniref:DEAD/DEAH box helicase n=1 Tax=Nocardioides sp. TaxID=35761 RepID=UPI00262948E1|nr:DEAD/DEAH box helicase [Nocardioides sp.]MCW2833900.1 ATP-dependent helicase HepA [Nocardioides sp.]